MTNAILNKVNEVTTRENGNYTVAVQEFLGADVEYYKGEIQKARYALIARTAHNKVYEMVIASMLYQDGSWGSGMYYDISDDKEEGYFSIEKVIDIYNTKCEEYREKMRGWHPHFFCYNICPSHALS